MSAAALRALGAALGEAQVLTGTATEKYLHDERGLFHGRALAVLCPATVAAVAQAVTLCAAHRLAMVPHGGNTGYCGGATPDASGQQVVISLERLNRILAVDAEAYTLTLEAGVTLADAQAAAAHHARLLPLSMGSQGSCQIGGNLSTNAGGLAVLKYGNARDLTLGLQVVLPDGRVFDRLRGLRKDNTGYDLKHLFIGAEGTLGIITAAVLKLFPAGAQRCAWATLSDAAEASRLLARLRAATADAVTSFEYMTAEALARLTVVGAELQAPLTGRHHVLIEARAQPAEHGADAALDQALLGALQDGALEDVVIAHNETQRRHFWRMREAIPAAEKLLGGSIKHDVSVPLASVADFIARGAAAIGARWPDARQSIYGHVGDGNVHFNVLAPAAVDAALFKQAHAAAISATLHDLAHAMAGSFSAEHGVGALKRELLAHYGDEVAVDLMRRVKRELDPLDLMNPGKLVP